MKPVSYEKLRRMALEDGDELVIGDRRFNSSRREVQLEPIKPPPEPPPPPPAVTGLTKADVIALLEHREQAWREWMGEITRTVELLAKQSAPKRPRKWVFKTSYEADKIASITAQAIE